MMRRRRMVDRLSDVWSTDTGHKVRVQIMDAPDISQEADFQPRRIALTKKTPLVHAGTVITRGLDSFLLVSQSTLVDMQNASRISFNECAFVIARDVFVGDGSRHIRFTDSSFLGIRDCNQLVAIKNSRYFDLSGCFAGNFDTIGEREEGIGSHDRPSGIETKGMGLGDSLLEGVDP